MSFLSGWTSGLLMAQKREQLRKRFLRILWSIIIFIIIFVIIESSASFLSRTDVSTIITGMLFGMMVGMMGMDIGVAFGVMAGVAFGVAFGVMVGVGMVSCVASCVAFGAPSVMFCVVFAVMAGVVKDVAETATLFAFGVAFGVAMAKAKARDMSVGVVVGVSVGVFVCAANGMVNLLFIIMGVLRIWFWIPELLFVLFINLWIRTNPFHSIPKTCVKVLPYLPFYYDELIHLPLPFIPDIIANAYQANQTAARHAIDYLITRTNQQKTAARAIAIISLNSLLTCRNTNDITALPDSLSWITAFDHNAPVLSKFMDISQEVRTATQATTYFRQSRMMTKPIEMLGHLRTSLSRKDAGTATRYGAAIEHWIPILETAQKALQDQARKEGEIPQEYIAGPSLKPQEAGDRFKGRNDIFREIEMLILSPQAPTLLLFGQRRTGKTSLLRHLPWKLGTQVLPILIDMQRSAQAITLPGLAGMMAKQIKAEAESILQKDLSAPDSEALKRDPFIALETWFDQIEAKSEGRTILLCLDEFEKFDEFVEATNSRAPLNFLRSVTQNRTRWGLLFSGSHTRDELRSYWSDYLIGTRTVVLDYLTRDETHGLIRKPVPDFPDIYEDETVEAISNLTQGQPMLTQLLCYEIVEHLNKGKRQKATPEDAEAVIPKAFESAYQYFHEFWTTLTDKERNVLLALTKDGSQSETHQDALTRLIRRGVVIQKNEGHIIRVPLIQRWIKENGDSTL